MKTRKNNLFFMSPKFPISMKLLVLIGLLIISLAGCGLVDMDLNESTNMTTNETDVSNSTQIVDVDKDTEVTPVDTNIPTKVIKEGESIEFKKDLAYDPDGDSLTYTFGEPLDEDGSWTTELGDAGEYIVEVTVSDGKLNSKQKIRLIVESINKLPVIENFDNIEVNEGDLIELDPKFEDEDGDDVTYSLAGFMDSTTYQTTYDDAGVYEVTLTASDGKQTTSKTIDVTINNVNRAPVIEPLESITLLEGETATISISSNDPDGDALSTTIGKPFTENGTWETEEGDAGVYNIKVEVSDGELTTSETLEVTVKSLNNAPTLEIDDEITVNEGEKIELNPIIGDADGDALKVTYSGFMTSSTYQTNYEDAGVYETTISVTDGKETVEQTIEITIEDTNRAPVFNTDLFE